MNIRKVDETVESLKVKIKGLDTEEAYYVFEELGIPHRQIDYNFQRNGWHDGVYLVYLKNGMALLPFSYEEYESGTREMLAVSEITSVGEEEIVFLEKALHWYQDVTRDLEEALEKQRLRKLFREKN